MKSKKIIIGKDNDNEKSVTIPFGRFESEWFKCTKCGHTVQMLVRGDTATCSQCGGTMKRC